MKTLKEKIEVMQHFEKGGEIEYYSSIFGWVSASAPTWNWETTNFRKAETPIKKDKIT